MIPRINNPIRKKITIGVTGFAGSGKTVFICSLAHALLCSSIRKNRGASPLSGFRLRDRDQLISAQIPELKEKSQIDDFPFEAVRDNFCGNNSNWPKPTEGISKLALDIEYCGEKFNFKYLQKLRLELIDYPGEWLIDLPMLKMNYSQWSDQSIARANKTPLNEWSSSFFNLMPGIAANQNGNNSIVSDLSSKWKEFLQKCSEQGYMLNQPGRILRPDKLVNSPLLDFVPLPSLYLNSAVWKEMAKRYENYKKKVIKPFYKKNFKNLDRQIILIDLLQALELGEPIYDEMLSALRETLQSFKFGKGGLLSFLGGIDITHVLFAATKADHVIPGDRNNLKVNIENILQSIDPKNQLRGSIEKWDTIAIASLRATEDRRTIQAPIREILFGHSIKEKKTGQWDPGGIPLEMPPDWKSLDFVFHKFSPMQMKNAQDGFPAINLGKALDFLIGDDVQ